MVIVHPAEARHNLNNHGADNPRDLLTTFAVSMAIPGCNNINVMGDVLLVPGPEHAEIIASAGWSKNDVRSYLYELARQPLSLLKLCGIHGRHTHRNTLWPRWIERSDDDAIVPVVRRLEGIQVNVAGGPGRHSVYIPGWGSRITSTSVTWLALMNRMDMVVGLETRIAELGLVDPTDRQEEPERRSAAPLEGLTGGLLDNWKGNADVILDAIRQRLADGYSMAESVARSKWVFSAPGAPEIIDELAQCDFVAAAVGDWGSCVARSLRDAVELEDRGVRTVVVYTQAFCSAAEQQSCPWAGQTTAARCTCSIRWRRWTRRGLKAGWMQ